jgi:hypothetical protein
MAHEKGRCRAAALIISGDRDQAVPSLPVQPTDRGSAPATGLCNDTYLIVPLRPAGRRAGHRAVARTRLANPRDRLEAGE